MRIFSASKPTHRRCRSSRRTARRRWTFVVANLSDKPLTVRTPMNKRRAATDLLEGGRVSSRRITVAPFGVGLVGDPAR